MRRSLIGIGLVAVMAAVIPSMVLALSVSGDYDSVRIDRRAKEVVVTGRVTCDAGTTGHVRAVVLQGTREGAGEAPISCTGSETTWEVRIPLGSPPFHPGKAILEFGWQATDGTTTVVSGRSVDVKIVPR